MYFQLFLSKTEHGGGAVGGYVSDHVIGVHVVHIATQTGEVTIKETGLAGGMVAGLPLAPSLAMYHGSWPMDKGEFSTNILHLNP